MYVYIKRNIDILYVVSNIWFFFVGFFVSDMIMLCCIIEFKLIS